MPMQWVEPLKAHTAKTHRGDVEIYHTYKDGYGDSMSTYSFTTHMAYDDTCCDEDCVFDVRDLDGYGDKSDAEVIADAINSGALKHPDDLDY